MISLRQHAISLVAVFLALAVGVALGSGFVSDRIHDGGDSGSSSLRSQNDGLSAQVNAADSFNSAIAPRLLRGLLADRSVVVVTVPGTADADVSAVKQILNQAGAGFSGQIGLTDDLVGDTSAQKLTTIVDQAIPAGATLRPELTDSGGRVGDLLGALLLRKVDAPASVNPGDVTAGLQALREGGYISYVDGSVQPGQLAVVVTGGELPADSGARGQLVARFAAAFGARGTGAVLSGRTGSAEGGSPVAVVRSDGSLSKTVSTVDDVDTSAGRIATALALAEAQRGRTGAYGVGPGASAVVPAT
ncbi:copper transporter [Williamsia deligens]|uniref:Copper transporter n=1 Tax=Williamsia deligens TaxID=321325 RepID=A0ABW3G9T1_9NOCA|nr:copper transporter [Williamsia deligens]MCP2196132.1 Copper transport outer membrane protein, MctB [Williamsia deligens]